MRERMDWPGSTTFGWESMESLVWTNN